MREPALISTIRVGQLTGSMNGTWPALVDPLGLPLLNDIGAWGAWGVDLGANAEHDGRLFIFFGDIARKDRTKLDNIDLVAWTEDEAVLRHGGHLPPGDLRISPPRDQDHNRPGQFCLPTAPGEGLGQYGWRFCAECHVLFWPGSARQGCPSTRGQHRPMGEVFWLPHEPNLIEGQRNWRFCVNCAGLFWAGQQYSQGVCHEGGTHKWMGEHFVLPTQGPGQKSWRYCVNCRGLFYDGCSFKGVCAGARGGGFRLSAPLLGEELEPFTAPQPIDVTGPNETPSGAFSFGGRAYVFAGIADQRWTTIRRDGNPGLGLYLFSKEDPAALGQYCPEFLLSPRMGWCALATGHFDSHQVRGLRFVPSTAPAGEGRIGGWRACRKCEGLFWWRALGSMGVCQRGGSSHPMDDSSSTR